jgi:hypothetical protein
VANIGSSGQDGVSFELGPALSCDLAWLPLAQTNPLGAWVQFDYTGSVSGIVNRSLGHARVTHDASIGNGYAISADLRAIGSPTERVEVWNQGVQLAVFTGMPTGIVARASSWPIGGGKTGRGILGTPYILSCLNLPWSSSTDLLVNGTHFVADQLLVLQEGTPSVDHLSGMAVTAANVPDLAITQMTSAPLPPRLAVSAAPGNNITIQWSGGGVLQESSTLAAGGWSDVANAASPYTVAPTAPKRFFRVRR